jgi:hypothetical protein
MGSGVDIPWIGGVKIPWVGGWGVQNTMGVQFSSVFNKGVQYTMDIN